MCVCVSGWRKKLDSNKKKRRKQGNKYLIKKRKSTIQRISNHKSIKNLLLYLSWLKMEIKNHFALFPFHGWCTHNLCVYTYRKEKYENIPLWWKCDEIEWLLFCALWYFHMHKDRIKKILKKIVFKFSCSLL